MTIKMTLRLAAAVAVFSLGPTSILANAKLDKFYKFMDPTNIESVAKFKNKDIEIVGATVLVMGTDKNSGELELSVIEYSGAGNGKGIARKLGKGVGPKGSGIPSGGYSSQAVGVNPAEACDSQNEPVLYAGQEDQYQINWCRKYNSSPKWAKKNYYYLFSNGDVQLVATVRYNCNDPADTAQMPGNVYPGACQ